MKALTQKYKEGRGKLPSMGEGQEEVQEVEEEDVTADEPPKHNPKKRKGAALEMLEKAKEAILQKK